MLINLLNWIWIFISAFLWGFLCVNILERYNKSNKKELDLLLMTGICMLTVFAQFFSLFHGVGKAANCVVLLINILITALYRKELLLCIQKWIQSSGAIYMLSIIIICTFAFLLLSCGPIYHYDTNLYHAQSIHWIEDYGVVPGLGNLHNRLAYNSSFFCLQALFSWRFLVGKSLHNMNGFFCLILLSYTLCSLKVLRDKKTHISDFLRLSVLIFLSFGENLWVFSSPGSDFLSLGLVLYIFIKWVSYLEDQTQNISPFALLCILGIFAISVKLSSFVIILLVIMPAVRLIKQKKWEEILLYLSAGLVVILPFLIRNVIISGYLIYPFPELNLFSVDWKIPAFELLYDRNEIKVWGWGLNDIKLFATPFKEWFPVWLSQLDKYAAVTFFSNFFFAVIGIYRGIMEFIRKRNGNYLLTLCVIMGCFLFWLFNSPLPRYGIIFTVLLPLFVLGDLFTHSKLLQKNSLFPVLLTCILGTYFMYPFADKVLHTEIEYPIINCDYEQFAATAYNLEDVIIYIPEYGDQGGVLRLSVNTLS